MVILDIKGVSKNFGGLTAVENVSFGLFQGEILGLIGPNGAGKTTLFNLITGFISPSSGEVIYRGEKITRLPPHVIAAKGLVRTFQITNLFPNLSVFKNVLVGRHLKNDMRFWRSALPVRKGCYDRTANEGKVAELLSLAKLEDVKHEPVKNLSHGLQNLVQIVTAVAAEPRVLLLDEPAGGLNPEETQQVSRLIRKVRDLGTTVLLVEHNMRVIMGICDRIVALNYGRKIAEGTPQEISRNREVIEAYLGSSEFA